MLKEWMERNLQEPFLRAELLKAEAYASQGGQNLGTVKALAFFGVVYMAFCVFWYAKYAA